MEMIKKQNLGVEVEFRGITRKEAARAIADKFGWRTPQFESSYSTWYTIDDTGRKWKIVRDGSITAPDSQKCELVTPILKYEDIELLQEVIRTIRKAGGRRHSSCGIHVHVNKENHNSKTLRNLVNIMYSKEDLIYEALNISHERKTNWCRPVREDFVEKTNDQKPELNGLADLWYEETPDYRNNRYNSTRYRGLNLHNVWYKNTVEFRYFNSTMHAGKVKAYIQFCLAVSAQAIRQKYARANKTQTDNPKYTFRTWLLRLGLNGDHFKTARLHLLRNLEGNSAWRDRETA